MANYPVLYPALFALANKPQDNKNIYDWCPFNENTMAYIINKVHEAIGKFTNHWSDNLKKLRQYIDLIEYDISEIEKVQAKEWNRIQIILIDLNTVREYEKDKLPKKLGIISKELGISCGLIPRTIHIGQINNGNPIEMECFYPLSVYPSIPPIFRNETELIDWLIIFCQFTNNSVKGVAPNSIDYYPEGIPKEILERIYRLSYNVRDRGMTEGLTLEKTEELAKLAAMQNDSLIGISEQIYNETGNYPDFINLLFPINKIPVVPVVEPKPSTHELMYVNLTTPFYTLSKPQKKKVYSIGIRDESPTVMLKASGALKYEIKKLGGIVDAKEFSAMIPTWEIKK